jgi:signal transduction histidine kinase
MWPIVREALAGAPPDVRSQIRWIAVFWVVMVCLQIWDSADGRGAAGLAEFLGALLAVSGAALLGLAFGLQRTLEHSAQRPSGDAVGGLQEVLIALPAMGFASGVALGGATMLMVVRVVLGVEWPLAVAGIGLYSLLLIVAGGTVTRSARTLFDHATRQAALAAEARSEAAEAQLAALQARMNPHFLFNALNTVAALVRSNAPAAERVVEDLADVLRTTLQRSTETMSTVGEEIDYLRAYLAVEQERWGERLRVVWDVPEPVRDVPLPPMLLQPLVENALEHGLARITGGSVRIAAHESHGRLTFTVEDDGVGFRHDWRAGTGIGNLRQRLATVYGTDASLDVEPLTSGARVRLNVPASRPA